MPLGADFGVVGEEGGGADEEIVKIEGATGGFGFFIGSEEFGDLFLLGIIGAGGIGLGSVAMIFAFTDGAEDEFGLEGFGVEFKLFGEAFDESLLIFGVINDEIGVEIGGGMFDAKKADGNTVEGAEIWKTNIGTKKTGNALAHFASGFVGEGDGEDLMGGGAVLDEVGDAMSEGFGFAGTGASENEEGAGEGVSGEGLSGVERGCF